MKLLVIVPALGSVYGGPSKSVLELAQALGQQNICVDVVTTNANGDTVVDVPLQQWIQKENYRVQYFPYLGIGDYKLSASITRWLFQNVQTYDLVQTNAIFSVPNLSAYLACRRAAVPYVVIPRGMLEPWALSYKAWKKKIYYRLIEHPALQRASAIQMLATTEAQQIQPLHLKAPLIISSNGIRRQDFEHAYDSTVFYQQFPTTKGKDIVLFLGRIDPKKGLDLLSTAWEQIVKDYSQVHLVIAGPDNTGFMPQVKQFFTEKGCLDAVTFTGILTGEMKYAALAAASYYVAPSYSEGFSMSVLEGMASGLPCIITTGCNFPQAAEAKAAHVVDIEAAAIAQALSECLSDPESAIAMGKRAKSFVLENYTWDSIARNLSSAYASLLMPGEANHA